MKIPDLGELVYQLSQFFERGGPVLFLVAAATLLLFGGPGPGGKAMSEYPKLGLDAFCQKILVLESADGSGIVSLHFNDIVALAKLHYGSSNKPQAVINKRLMATLSGAVQKPGNSK